MASAPREAVSRWKPMARRVFVMFMVLKSDEQGGKAIGEHTCAIKPNIPMRNSTRTHRPRVGITRGTLNMIMLGFGFVREEHAKNQGARNAPYRRNQYALRREEGEDVERVCPLSDCAEERVCGNDGMSERDEDGEDFEISDAQLPVPPRTPTSAALREGNEEDICDEETETWLTRRIPFFAPT
jgi:hypothetical protein